MGYLVEGLELFIRKVAYIMNDANVFVRWSIYTSGLLLSVTFIVIIIVLFNVSTLNCSSSHCPSV
jgi:hypothetical protein